MSSIRNFINLAMPQNCAGCGALYFEVCPSCALTLNRTAHQVFVKGVGACGFKITATAYYEGPAQKILIAAKERNQVALIPVIAKATLAAVLSLLDPVPLSAPLALVPVPSRSSNLRLRGYHLVLQISELVAAQLRMQLVDIQVLPILKHVRVVNDQSRLSAKQRAINLQNAFTSSSDYGSNQKVREMIIVDDLVTTGSTLIEARRALLSGGATVRGAACAMSSR